MVKVGVALGGGGARGYAHFGAMFALEGGGIPVHCVAGTSIGAAVGALWATDQHIECYKLMKNLDKAGVREYLDPELPMISGLLRGRRLYNVLESWFSGYNIENLSKLFCANAVNLNTGKEVTFNTGSLSDAVRASLSLPVILSPWRIGHSAFVDGGVVNPLPVRQCREMGADVVIAVNLLGYVPTLKSHWTENDKVHKTAHRFHLPGDITGRITDVSLLKNLRNPRVPETAFTAILISQKALVEANLVSWAPDYLIQPDLSKYSGAEFHLVEEISEIGLGAVEKEISSIIRNLRITI
jgi:NTE family protein